MSPARRGSFKDAGAVRLDGSDLASFVTLGLATIVATEFPDRGPQVRTSIVALTGLHVLIGPILLKAGLQRAGEINKI